MTHRMMSQSARWCAATAAWAGCMGANCNQIIELPASFNFNAQIAGDQGFCEDWGLGNAFHEGQDCFRKENCVFDCPQVCTDGAGNSFDSRDMVSPVVSTAPNGRCIYDAPWNPVTGVVGHGGFWGHALIDVVPAVFGGLIAP